MEDMLKAELDCELGYKKNSRESKTTDNRRNGSYPKKVTSNMGEIELNVPRDRKGEYEPELIPKGSHDVSALEEKVLSLYAKGTSDRDISGVINDIYGFKLSHETISNIVERIQPRVIERQNRGLEKVYPFVYMDALTVNIKSAVSSTSFGAMVGIDSLRSLHNLIDKPNRSVIRGKLDLFWGYGRDL